MIRFPVARSLAEKKWHYLGHQNSIPILGPKYRFPRTGTPQSWLLNYQMQSIFGPFSGFQKFAEALHQANPRLRSAKRTKRSMLWKAVLRWNVLPCLGQTRQATNCGLAGDGPMGTICLGEHVGLSENVGYIPTYSHLIGIMIINHWV